MKEIILDRPSRVVDYYQVVYQGMIVFTNDCRAICNSYICSNAIQGVRPTPVYKDKD